MNKKILVNSKITQESNNLSPRGVRCVISKKNYENTIKDINDCELLYSIIFNEDSNYKINPENYFVEEFEIDDSLNIIDNIKNYCSKFLCITYDILYDIENRSPLRIQIIEGELTLDNLYSKDYRTSLSDMLLMCVLNTLLDTSKRSNYLNFFYLEYGIDTKSIYEKEIKKLDRYFYEIKKDGNIKLYSAFLKNKFFLYNFKYIESIERALVNYLSVIDYEEDTLREILSYNFYSIVNRMKFNEESIDILVELFRDNKVANKQLKQILTSKSSYTVESSFFIIKILDGKLDRIFKSTKSIKGNIKYYLLTFDRLYLECLLALDDSEFNRNLLSSKKLETAINIYKNRFCPSDEELNQFLERINVKYVLDRINSRSLIDKTFVTDSSTSPKSFYYYTSLISDDKFKDMKDDIVSVFINSYKRILSTSEFPTELDYKYRKRLNEIIVESINILEKVVYKGTLREFLDIIITTIGIDSEVNKQLSSNVKSIILEMKLS